MDWNQIRKQGFIDVSGARYDITHLRVFRFKFSIPATDSRPEIKAEMEVKFSSHCVSIGPKRNEEFDFDQIGADHLIVDGTGIKRRFCPDRYHLSHQLRDIIRSLPEGRKCFFNRRENWITVEVLGAGRTQQFYDIYFKLHRKPTNYLVLYLESAFIRDKGRSIAKRKTIGSKVLLGKTLRGEPIFPPPK